MDGSRANYWACIRLYRAWMYEHCLVRQFASRAAPGTTAV